MPDVAGEVTCQEFVELITDYLEDALAAPSLGLIEEHLVMCDWCVTYAEQMQTTIASLPEPSEPVTHGPPQAVLAALLARRSTGE